MSEQQFKPGDVVQMKSGGPIMTVNYISADGKTVECTWFDKQEQPQSAEFSPGVLGLFSPPKPVDF